ncbi:MAG TPA: DUF4424 domain-containing protein [Allosphingosinicella sp.]|jgi:hypothetical protein
MRKLLLIAAAALCWAPAHANDSIAEVSAGGLVLTRTDAIDMVSEDLFISAQQGKVRYVFRNRTAKDVRAVVAFPLPDDDLSLRRDGDVAYPTGFTTQVDGKPVTMAVERRAFLGAVDHTPLLTRLGLPLSYATDSEGGSPLHRALDALPQAAAERLLRLGLVAADGYGTGNGVERHLVPLWTVKETWHWPQTFPAGRPLAVEHRYVPGTGASVGTPLASKQFRRSAEGRRIIAAYCADAGFLAGLDRLARADGGEYGILPDERVGYVLKTGANWASPIGRFRLVIDKGAPENLVSLCATGLRKISPTQFELVRTNWRPDRDLQILIVQPAPRP